MNINSVTIGAGYNDLSVITGLDFIDGKTSPTPSDYHGYTDSNSIQYILYDKTLNKTNRLTNSEDDNISFEIGLTSVETF